MTARVRPGEPLTRGAFPTRQLAPRCGRPTPPQVCSSRNTDLGSRASGPQSRNAVSGYRAEATTAPAQRGPIAHTVGAAGSMLQRRLLMVVNGSSSSYSICAAIFLSRSGGCLLSG